MYFDENYVMSLPDSSLAAILRILEDFSLQYKQLPAGDDTEYELVKEVCALLSAYVDREGIKYSVPTPTGDRQQDIKNTLEFVGTQKKVLRTQVTKLGFEQSQQVYRLMLGRGFHYELSEGDLARVQRLINELRDLITASGKLEPAHKQRVLNRLEKLQSELNKRVSDFDRFYGTLIELSIAARIIGENCKPIVDRIRELAGIVWPVQARAFDLPSNTPFRLPGETKDEEKP